MFGTTRIAIARITICFSILFGASIMENLSKRAKVYIIGFMRLKEREFIK
jgi:hypothetical protein